LSAERRGLIIVYMKFRDCCRSGDGVNATKEWTAALQSVHDRCETLRFAFADLTSASYAQNLIVTAANAPDFALAQRKLERRGADRNLRWR
jgi:hypothetical protein